MATHAAGSSDIRRGTSTSDQVSGWSLFAGVVLIVVGFLNLLDGIAAIAQSHVYVGNAVYVMGDLRGWGWAIAIIGGLQVLAGGGVLVRNQAARWAGVVFVSVNLVGQMFFIPAYPIWSLTIMFIDVVALCALCAFGGKDGSADF
jgi:hypothetical protein